jgi:hypothetical protein
MRDRTPRQLEKVSTVGILLVRIATRDIFINVAITITGLIFCKNRNPNRVELAAKCHIVLSQKCAKACSAEGSWG